MTIDIPGFSDADIDKALANISLLPPHEQQQLLENI
jgi:hypothetical protein